VTELVRNEAAKTRSLSGRVEAATPEVANAQHASARCREHEILRRATDDSNNKSVLEERRNRHSALLVRLRWAEDHSAIDFGHCLGDSDSTAHEIEVFAPQGSRLAPTQAAITEDEHEVFISAALGPKAMQLIVG
jgi:hypothetical protein